MNNARTKNITRWGIIAAVAVIVILLVGGAIFAQGGGPGWGSRHGQGQGGGMGPWGQGRMGMQGGGMERGPGALVGMQFMMQDPEIRDLAAQIRIIEGINKLGLDKDQVKVMRDAAAEAQGIVDSQFGDIRDQVRDAMKGQLNDALAGKEVDRDAIKGILDDAREQHEPGEIRDQLRGVMEKVTAVLTDEQQQMIVDKAGPREENVQRFRDRFEQNDGAMRWLQGLSDEEREQLRQRVTDHMGDLAEGRARMGITMFLLSPKSVEAMDLWLEAH